MRVFESDMDRTAQKYDFYVVLEYKLESKSVL